MDADNLKIADEDSPKNPTAPQTNDANLAHSLDSGNAVWNDAETVISARPDTEEQASPNAVEPVQTPQLRLPTSTRFADRYEIRKELGVGGMGVVVEAWDVKLDRSVAIKQIRPKFDATSMSPQRLREEAVTAAQLNHANILSVIDYGETCGTHYFTMPMCSNGTLACRMGPYKGDGRRSAELIAKLARALHYAHSKGVIHRDLKPSNVLFDESDTPRISDFGLALYIRESDTWGEVHLQAGTPGYMAPEQTSSSFGSPSAQTDVWALGVMLFELLTGRLPFQGMGKLELTQRICHEDPPEIEMYLSPSEHKSSAGLDAIIRKCLQKSPASRYRSAEELAVALEAWTNQESLTSPMRRLVRKRPWTTLAIATVAAAVFIGVIINIRPPRPVFDPEGNAPVGDAGEIARQLRAGKTVTLIGPKGLPEYYRYATSGRGRPKLSTEPDAPVVLFSEHPFLVELVPVTANPGEFEMTAEVRITGEAGECEPALYFGYHEIERGNRTEHWFFSNSYLEGGQLGKQGRVVHTYYHERLKDPERADHFLSFFDQDFVPLNNPAENPGDYSWRNLKLRVDTTGYSFWVDSALMCTRNFADMAALRAKGIFIFPDRPTKQLIPPFPQAADHGPIGSSGGIGICVTYGSAMFRNVTIKSLN